MAHVFSDSLPRFAERQRDLGADAIALEGFVPAFDLAVGLRIVGRGLDVGHAGDANELFELAGNELWAVVADDARCGGGEGFASALQDDLHVGFLHFFADFEVNDEATGPIEDATEEVEGAGDVEVTDIDMPVFVRCEWLREAGTFLGGLGR
jgi:hypothetical protein